MGRIPANRSFKSNGEGKLRLLTSSERLTTLTASTTAGGGTGAAGSGADCGGATLILAGLLFPFPPPAVTATADGAKAPLLDELGRGECGWPDRALLFSSGRSSSPSEELL